MTSRASLTTPSRFEPSSRTNQTSRRSVGLASPQGWNQGWESRLRPVNRKLDSYSFGKAASRDVEERTSSVRCSPSRTLKENVVQPTPSARYALKDWKSRTQVWSSKVRHEWRPRKYEKT